ncbi:MAG: hypothetical protein H7X70_01250 [Candidatus Kapabacteria bacterium]|nr:hypothetical protein [Candidatus Kapabacteria bacterium]
MYKKLAVTVLNIIAFSLMHAPAYTQWETNITCHETWVDLRPEQGWSGVIPRCMDTLRIGITKAMQKHYSSADPVCARLFRFTLVAGSRVRQEIPAEIICTGPSLVTLIPRDRLPVIDVDEQPVQYEVQLYCTYWHGSQEHDTSRITFRKATGFKAYARAVDVSNGADITTLRLVEPTIANQDHSVHDGMMLTAFEGAGYTFERWTTDDAQLLPNATAPRQLLDSLCWPVQRAVEYVAHFRKSSTDVQDTDAQCERTVQQYESALHISSPCEMNGHVNIYDLHGRLVHSQPIASGQVSILTDSFPMGLYAIVVNDRIRATTHPLMIIKKDER